MYCTLDTTESSKMAANLKLNGFSPEEEEFESYLERLEQLFIISKITTEKEKVAHIITTMGPSTYATLKDISRPKKPADLTFEEISTKLKRYYGSNKPVMVHRLDFYRSRQATNESLTDFLSDLKKKASFCDFGSFREEAIRDIFLCGVLDVSIQRALFAKDEKKLTLAEAEKISLNMEAAARNTDIINESTDKFRVGKVSNGSDRQKSTCFCCGKNGHKKSECRYREYDCNECGKTGHLSVVCMYKSGNKWNSRSNDQPTGNTSNLSNNRPHTSSTKPKSRTSSDKRRSHKSERGERPRQNVKPMKKSSKVKHVYESSDETSQSDSVSESGENPVYYVKTTRVNEGKPITVKLKIEGSKIRMEADTGCAKSLVSKAIYNRYFGHIPLKRSNMSLRTLTNEDIMVQGTIKVKVRPEKGQKVIKLPLVVVGDDRSCYPSLLGRDWLAHIKLDWNRLFKVNKVHERLVSNDDSIEDTVAKYDVFNNELGCIKGVQVKLEIEEDAEQKFFKPRPIPFALKDKVADELNRMVKNGVLEKIEYNDWSTPIVPVRKPSGDVRICGDYKITINPVLKVKEHPLPLPEELFQKLNGGEKFSKLDLSNAYQQVELDIESRKYVCINTHMGLYRYTRLPFGVASATAIFQEIMEKIISGLAGVACYVDDLIVTGKNDLDHKQNLENLLQRLSKWGIRLKLSKCVFMRKSIEYLGFRVDAEGIHPTESKVEAILNAPEPTNEHELHSLCGVISYYRRFIPNLATIMAPLNALKGNKEFIWDDSCKTAFKAVKDVLSSAKVLVHYDPKKQISLATDASPYGVSAIISHTDNNADRPIAYASRSLTSAEKNYSQLEREALAIIFGITKFHQYLYARQFTLWTDNKPLSLILGPKKGIPVLAASRLQRWAVMLGAYSYDIKFRSAEKNGNADFLSRLPIKNKSKTNLNKREDFTVFWTKEGTKMNQTQINSLPITHAQISRATEKDKILSRVLHFIKYGWPDESTKLSDELAVWKNKQHELTIEENCILWGLRVVIPEKYRNRILSDLHSQHPGIVRMKSLARMHVYWPNITADIEHTVQSCSKCQMQTDPVKASKNPWIWPSRPGARVHIDFAGPFMGGMYMIIIDAHSKWIDVVQMNKITSAATIKVLTNTFASWGIPEQIVSDNGPAFISQEFEMFMTLHGIKHIKSSPNHPASNGEAEQCVKTFKRAMKKQNDNPGDMSTKISNFLMTYRSTPNVTTKETPSKLFLGRELRTKLSLLKPDLSNSIMKKKSSIEDSTRSLTEGSRVLVRDYRRNTDRWSEGLVVSKLGPVTYTVLVGNETWKRHIDQLKENKLSEIDNVQNRARLSRQHVSFPDYVADVEIDIGEDEHRHMNSPRRSMRQRKHTQRLIEA